MNQAIIERLESHLKEKGIYDKACFDWMSNVLRSSICTKLVVRLDFHEMKAKTDFTHSHIQGIIEDKYELSSSTVEKAIYCENGRTLDKILEVSARIEA